MMKYQKAFGELEAEQITWMRKFEKNYGTRDPYQNRGFCGFYVADFWRSSRRVA